MDLHTEIKTIENIARRGNEDDTLDIHIGRFLKGFNLVKDMLEYEL